MGLLVHVVDDAANSAPDSVRVNRPVNADHRGGDSAPLPGAGLYRVVLFVLAAVPIPFLTGIHRAYTLPKFVLLLIGSAGLATLLALLLARKSPARARLFAPLLTRYFALVAAYFGCVAISTLFGASPVASLLGSFENQMGLITHVCFFLCFAALIVGIGKDSQRLNSTLWLMCLTGLVIAAYGLAQFFGIDPFISPSLYTVTTAAGPVVRVPGTLGHPDHMGHFLLYTGPLGLGLALANRGQARRIALASAVFCSVAIVATGTRGAWVGLAAGLFSFAAFESRTLLVASMLRPLRLVAGICVALIIAFAATIWIWSSGSSTSIATRARSFVSEGWTGSGRTVLWKDAIKMVPKYALVGCGPEGFRKAFLPYKSIATARISGTANNESSHNAYLDTAISYGLPGLSLYIAIIASAFLMLVRARKHAVTGRDRLMITGVIASLTGASIHGIFIFDMIPTGLYFFAFLAIAQAADHIYARPEVEAAKALAPADVATAALRNFEAHTPRVGLGRTAAAPRAGASLRTVLIAMSAIIVTASVTWYSAALLRADHQLALASRAAATLDFPALLQTTAQISRAPDSTHGYDLALAKTLADFADSIAVEAARHRDDADYHANVLSLRQPALNLATAHATKAIGRGFEPDSVYLLLAYIALRSGNTESLKSYAEAAVDLDPNFANSRWLLGEAYMAEGNMECAAREAQALSDLEPRPTVDHRNRKLPRLMDPRARGIRRLVRAGDNIEAEKEAFRVLALTTAPCRDCHRWRAELFEREGFDDRAAVEWLQFIKESTDANAIDAARHRIAALHPTSAFLPVPANQPQ